MTQSNDQIVATLNGLIETCKDGQQGFETAAGGVDDADVRSLFERYAQQRARFASELQAEVRRLGGTPETGGSVGGALHHAWMNIKSALASRKLSAVVAEAENGEDVALEAYRKALEQPLPPDVLAVVERQADAVQEAHDRVLALKRRLEAAD